MTGPKLLIVAIIVVLVIAFIITVVIQNMAANKFISANTLLVKNQNALLEQNKALTEELQESREALKKASQKENSTNAATVQELNGNCINPVKRELEQPQVKDEVAMLREQTQRHRENIRQTANMSDEELLEWLDGQMENTRIFTNTDLTLKTMAHAFGLTQKRLRELFKDHPKYGSFGDYINEKRFLEGCRLLREEPNWTIEAVGAAAGFGGRRTFQTEVKRRLGITPFQYRQANDKVKTYSEK